MAKANRTKYNRRSAGANPPTAGESTVVTMIPFARPNVLSHVSMAATPRSVKTERSIQSLTSGPAPVIVDRERVIHRHHPRVHGGQAPRAEQLTEHDFRVDVLERVVPDVRTRFGR